MNNILQDLHNLLTFTKNLDQFGAILEQVHLDRNCPLNCLDILPTYDYWDRHLRSIYFTLNLTHTLYPDPSFFKIQRRTRRRIYNLLERYRIVGARHDCLHLPYWTFRPAPG